MIHLCGRKAIWAPHRENLMTLTSPCIITLSGAFTHIVKTEGCLI